MGRFLKGIEYLKSGVSYLIPMQAIVLSVKSGIYLAQSITGGVYLAQKYNEGNI